MSRDRNLSSAKVHAELPMLREENAQLRSALTLMQSEVYGARLAAKYLDKELAGR